MMFEPFWCHSFLRIDLEKLNDEAKDGVRIDFTYDLMCVSFVSDKECVAM